MPAQIVKEVSVEEARRLVSKGKPVAPSTYAIPSQNITVTIRERTRPGYVKLIVTKGCVC